MLNKYSCKIRCSSFVRREKYASRRPRSLLFLDLADTLRGRHGVTRIEDIRKLRSSDGIMRSPMTGLSPFESTMVILHSIPCLRFDSSVIPIWFDTSGIRLHDFWTGRIEWMGQIFHMTHIRGAAHVIGNIVEYASRRPRSLLFFTLG